MNAASQYLTITVWLTSLHAFGLRHFSLSFQWPAPVHIHFDLDFRCMLIHGSFVHSSNNNKILERSFMMRWRTRNRKPEFSDTCGRNHVTSHPGRSVKYYVHHIWGMTSDLGNAPPQCLQAPFDCTPSQFLEVLPVVTLWESGIWFGLDVSIFVCLGDIGPSLDGVQCTSFKQSLKMFQVLSWCMTMNHLQHTMAWWLGNAWKNPEHVDR